MDQNENFQKLTERVAILENQSVQINSLLIKLETTITKLSDVSTSLKEFIAIHDHRLHQIEVDIDSHKEERIQIEHEHDARIHEIRDMIVTFSSELKQHMKNEESNYDEQLAQYKEIKEGMSRLGERVGSLEKWRWLIVGGALVLYFFFTLTTKVFMEGQYSLLPQKTEQSGVAQPTQLTQPTQSISPKK